MSRLPPLAGRGLTPRNSRVGPAAVKEPGGIGVREGVSHVRQIATAFTQVELAEVVAPRS